MLQSFLDKISGYSRNQDLMRTQLEQYVSLLNDDVARKTIFLPMKRGGNNFASHKLTTDNNGNIIFSPTMQYRIICSIFLLIGLFILGLGIVVSIITKDPGPLTSIIPGAIFLVIGIFFWYYMSIPIVFDISNRYFYKVKFKGDIFSVAQDPKYQGQIVQLKSIYALQIVTEYINYSKNRFYSYELNIVLNNGSRINVIDHGDLKQLQLDAKELAIQLKVPVWDVSNFPISDF